MWYSPEGLAAGQASNVMVGSGVNTTDLYAIDLWMQAPFHSVGILDPKLALVGMGSYREAKSGFQMAAALDVIRGVGVLPGGVTFPIRWPGDGKTTLLRAYTGGEYPDPLASCAGYSTPTGLPIILEVGSGNLTPLVTASSFSQNGSALPHCVYTEATYSNPDPSQQSLVRSILGARDAVVLIPRTPLTPGAAYNVALTVNGQTYSWSFSVASSAPAVPTRPEGQIR